MSGALLLLIAAIAIPLLLITHFLANDEKYRRSATVRIVGSILPLLLSAAMFLIAVAMGIAAALTEYRWSSAGWSLFFVTLGVLGARNLISVFKPEVGNSSSRGTLGILSVGLGASAVCFFVASFFESTWDLTKVIVFGSSAVVFYVLRRKDAALPA